MRSTNKAMNGLAGSGMLVLVSVAGAQTASNQVVSSEPMSMPALQEVIVTARRREESLQDVPQTVDAVSGDTLAKLSFKRFEDLQGVIPGLTLTSGNDGFTTAATLRGAAYHVQTGATPTVEFYLNDTLSGSNVLFQSTFDLGQVEVLRGPQGTLRGRASPSGSITVTTHKPDLDEMGPGVESVPAKRDPSGPRSTLGRPGMRGGWKPRRR